MRLPSAWITLGLLKSSKIQQRHWKHVTTVSLDLWGTGCWQWYMLKRSRVYSLGLCSVSDREGAHFLVWVISFQWKEPALMPTAGLFAGSPARESISCVWGPHSSKRNCKLFLSHLESSFRNSAHSCLLTPCQGQIDTHVDLPGLAIAQRYNKKPTSSRVTDHGSGTRLFVEFLCYNKRSGQCGNRNSNGLQMENYLMEQLSPKNVILSQSKCLWNYHFTNYFSGRGKKKAPTFLKRKHLEFFILYNICIFKSYNDLNKPKLFIFVEFSFVDNFNILRFCFELEWKQISKSQNCLWNTISTLWPAQVSG